MVGLNDVDETNAPLCVTFTCPFAMFCAEALRVKLGEARVAPFVALSS